MGKINLLYYFMYLCSYALLEYTISLINYFGLDSQTCWFYTYINLYIVKCMFCCTGNGFITTGVLREILKELDDKISAEELDMMIEEIDSDGSGTVDFDGMLLVL